MLKFNIVPTAKVLTKNVLRRRKIIAHYSEAPYPFALGVIIMMIAAILAISGHYGMVIALMGGLIIFMTIPLYHNNEKDDYKYRGILSSKKPVSPLTAITIGACLIWVIICLGSGLGFGFFIKSIIAAAAIKEIILPLPVYFMIKKRAEVCTETVTAYNTDIISEDYLYGDKSINYDSYDDEYGAAGDDIENYVCDCGNYCPEGYEYIYIADGKRYILTLPYSYTRTKENRSRRITLNIDPEHPENYYYPLYMPLRRMSDIIGGMVLFSVITAVLVWFLFLR